MRSCPRRAPRGCNRGCCGLPAHCLRCLPCAAQLAHVLLLAAQTAVPSPPRSPSPPRAQEERQEPDAEFKPNLINTICFLANFAIQARLQRGLQAALFLVRCLCAAATGHTAARRPGQTLSLNTCMQRPACHAPLSFPPFRSLPPALAHPQTMTFAVNYVGEPFNTPLEQNRLFAASVRWSAALYVALVIDIPRGGWWWGCECMARGCSCCCGVARSVAFGWPPWRW